MHDSDVITLRGILEKNTPGMGHTTDHRLNNVTIEVDLSEVSGLDESLEGQPMSVEGRFETRQHPELGTRWVFKAHSARSESFSGRGGSQTAPPPGGSRSAP